ncbi:MAG: radical SAM protein, partial [Novosphingobium sp.]|nr:radical SAM protein [Novosphingobium sp.]
NPSARLVVTGCAAEVERAALAAMPEVDGFVANAVKLDPRAWNAPEAPPAPHARHTRAFVQVQNGCDHACTFCVIPQGRGTGRSRATADVLAEVARHLDGGTREVVLTGVDLTSWGNDFTTPLPLGALVEAILRAFPELERLRLSSLDGPEIDSLLLELLSGESRVMPHVHLSLQSGNDLILKRMKRRHSRADAERLVSALRAARPGIALGADLIAGFPTEDAAAHADNLSAIEKLGVVHGHVFPYSPRPGTPAARMPQVPPTIVKARAAELREHVAAQRSRWLAGLVGKPLAVLAERDGTGHSPEFARVRLPQGTQPGTVVSITANRIERGMLA